MFYIQGSSNKPKNYYFSSLCRRQEVISNGQNFQIFFNIISLKCLKGVEKSFEIKNISVNMNPTFTI